MSAFDALGHYEPALVLLLGFATFAGVLGSGFSILRALRLRLPSPWSEVVAALAGIATLSLGVQLLAMAHLSSRPVLVALWVAFVGVGSTDLIVRVRGQRWRLPALRSGGNRLLAATLLAAATVNLLLAVAPSTKIDELHYQMLVGARIAFDGELIFYLRPWEASVLPQMAYSIAGAPLHALGYHDAPNVLSWCFSVLLAWFAARIVHSETGSTPLSLLAATGTQVGLYASVYHTTGGAHALGDLASAAALLALVFRERLLRDCSAAGTLLVLSICGLVAASTKVSLLPLVGLVLLLGFAETLRATRRAAWPRMLAAVALPWVVLYLPLCIWTLLESGSPFGPMLTDVFAPSVFDASLQVEMDHTRRVNQGGLARATFYYLLNYPALFPLAALAALALPGLPRSRRAVLGSLLLVQVLIVAILLPHQDRFFAGLHHALLVVGLVQVASYSERWLARPRLAFAAIGVVLLPWLGVQAYRASALAPVALGLEDEQRYYQRFIPLYADFQELDRILPEDSVLMARDRLPLLYFPRPVYLHHRDLPAGRRVFTLLGTSSRPLEDYDCAYMRLPADCRLGEPAYENLLALYNIFRTPGRAPAASPMEVREVLQPVSPSAWRPESEVPRSEALQHSTLFDAELD